MPITFSQIPNTNPEIEFHFQVHYWCFNSNITDHKSHTKHRKFFIICDWTGLCDTDKQALQVPQGFSESRGISTSSKMDLGDKETLTQLCLIGMLHL